ncbi:hypothetical protein TSUD_58700 [Trifolium subterraneum]|uniref:Reverse transcriptase zinc-binding domain-containing protein n=1 Tax=Trifolium subterraneum TaxID=3900 RepID=A0A2Z6M9A5_TRISU|nr:hypothetical protein TSUD_58700 [Trifolium subterraneum]
MGGWGLGGLSGGGGEIFQWENELVEACGSLVMGVERKEEESDSWQWGGESYTVKNVYLLLIEGEGEVSTWVGDVWSPLIPLRLSMLAWRLFQNRLPTKENLRRRGVFINSSMFCVGGCGELFNCPIFSMVWRKIVIWLGISVVFVQGGYDHYLIFKGLITGSSKVKDRMVEEIKVSSWKILRVRDKNFICNLYEWNLNPFLFLCRGAANSISLTLHCWCLI